MISQQQYRHALVSGGSIAGLSAAYWLARIGWRVTIVERAPSFREGGQNIDVRGVARDVLDRMGLFEAVKQQNTTETGTVIVDRHGHDVTELPDDGADGSTAELEILRGDLSLTIRDRLPAGVEFVYDDTIAAVEDPGGASRATVTTAAGRSIETDLVVIAEGVRSSTRELLFPGVAEVRELGVTMAFGTIDRVAGDDRRWRWHNATGGRQVHLRPDSHGTTRAILAYAGGRALAGEDRSDVLAHLRRTFDDAGWQARRVLAGFEASDDLYVDDLTQIRMPTWHRGRVCVTGDAAWCVTPMGGGGASLALTSGYVLAAELADIDPADPAAVDRGLSDYETWMRPLADRAGGMPPGVVRFAYPRTRAGVVFSGAVVKAFSTPPLSLLASRRLRLARSERPLPELPTAAAA